MAPFIEGRVQPNLGELFGTRFGPRTDSNFETRSESENFCWFNQIMAWLPTFSS